MYRELARTEPVPCRSQRLLFILELFRDTAFPAARSAHIRYVGRALQLGLFPHELGEADLDDKAGGEFASLAGIDALRRLERECAGIVEDDSDAD